MSAADQGDIGQRLATVENRLLLIPQILEVSKEHLDMIAQLMNAVGRVDNKVDAVRRDVLQLRSEVDAVHQDVLQLRSELVGVIDPAFPVVDQP